jgi:hypothetical protein
MRFGILAAMAAVVLAATGAAAQDMTAIFGNTVTMTRTDGSVTRLHFQLNGTYDFVTASGVTGGGTWVLENGQLCTTRLTPAPQPRMCRPAVDRRLGDKWDEDTPMGKVSYELVSGQ